MLSGLKSYAPLKYNKGWGGGGIVAHGVFSKPNVCYSPRGRFEGTMCSSV